MPPLIDLSGSGVAYGATPDIGGDAGLPLGFFRSLTALRGTVHWSGESRISIPVAKIAGTAPGFGLDFRLLYRSYEQDPASVLESDGSKDILPFGSFRPWWGDKLSVNASGVVERIDVMGRLYTYVMQSVPQGSPQLYGPSGRGDRIFNDNGTWYRELPDSTRIYYRTLVGLASVGVISSVPGRPCHFPDGREVDVGVIVWTDAHLLPLQSAFDSRLELSILVVRPVEFGPLVMA